MTENSSSNLFANLNPSLQAPAPEVEEAEAPPNELDMLKARARIMGITFSNAIKVEALRAKIKAKLDGDVEGETESETGKDEDGVDQREENDTALDDEDPVDETFVAAPVPPAAPKASSLLDQLKTMSASEKAQLLALLGGSVAPAAPVTGVMPVPQVAQAPAISPSKKLSMRDQLVAEQMALVRCRITNLDPKKADLPGEIFTVANEFIGTVKKYVPYGEVTDDGYHLPLCIYNQLIERTFVSIKTVKNKNGRGATTVTQDAREFSIDVLPQLTPDELARLANAQAAAAGN